MQGPAGKRETRPPGILAEAQGRAGRGFLEQAVGQQDPKDRVFPGG